MKYNMYSILAIHVLLHNEFRGKSEKVKGCYNKK